MWILAVPKVYAVALLVAFMSLAGINQGHAKKPDQLQFPPPISSSKNIRFYKVNKQLQADRVMLTDKKASSPGCQNFLKSVRVHRVVQTGYSLCSLYTEKNCSANSIVNVATEKDPRKTSLLTEGIGWLPQSDEPRGVSVASWSCGFELESGQLAYEARLAAGEAKRLATVASKAADRVTRAQRRAAEAKKVADKATDQADLAKRRAVTAGVVFPEEPSEVGKGAPDEEENEESSAAESTKE